MSYIPRLVRRDDVFYFRAAVPRSLTAMLGVHEFKFSLRTSDPKLAVMRSRLLSNAADALFEGLARMQTVAPPEIQERIKAYFRDALKESLETAYMLPTDPKVDLDAELASLEDMLAMKREQLRRRTFTPSVKSDALDMLQSLYPEGAAFDSETLQHAYTAILRANIENYRILAAKLAGRYDETAPRDPLFAGISVLELPPYPGEKREAPEPELTLEGVAARFVQHQSKQWVGKTAGDVDRVMRIAFAIIGKEKPVKKLDSKDVKAVRDALARLPPNYTKAVANKGLSIKDVIAANENGPYLASKTQDKYLSMFRQLLIWANQEEYIEKVPGANIKVSGVGKAENESRDPYSLQQLAVIFSSPLYRGHTATRRSQPGTVLLRDGRFWAPLIALHSGMRLGEIVQLLVTDLKCDSGIWYFDVTKGEDKRLKTFSSARKVPVHCNLLSMGILDLISAASGKARLFWEIEKGSDGYYSSNISKSWGRYARKIGAWAPGTAFHSFRHNFVDAVQAAELPEYVNKALVGHSDKSVHSQYGSGPNLKQLKASIDRVDYGIDLGFLAEKEIVHD